MRRPRVVRQEELTDAGQTPGMIRRAAFADPGVWIGLARTQPGAVSGWHHHGSNTTYLYCASGGVRVESGPGGSEVVQANAGDFMIIPGDTVHRESNPNVDESVVILTRVGTGSVLTNVEGPDLG